MTCRSEESILKEAKSSSPTPIQGYIHDGGPTANFRRPSCDKQLKYGLCKTANAWAPTPAPT